MTLTEGVRHPDLSQSFLTRLRRNTYLDRVDPLHEIAWSDAVRTRWHDISLTEHVLRISASGAVIHRDKRHWSAVEVSQSRQYSPNAIRAMALLSQFHQLSTLQLASFLDATVRTTWTAMVSLFEAGVVERALPEWGRPDDDRQYGGTGSLWRIDTRSPQVEKWVDGLSDLEYLLLTGGRDISVATPGQTSSTAARHNLVLTEIALRAVEMCPGVLGAWGEPHATAELMHDTADEQVRNNIGDGVIVGKDGRLVVVETSGRGNLDDGKSGKQIQAKAAAWAAIAARSELDISILFVDIAHSSKHHRFRYHVMKGVEAADKHLSRREHQRRARECVFTADAKQHWFPISSMVTTGFTRMEAFNPFTDRYHDLVPPDLAVDPNSDVVINTLAALHTPVWVVRDPVDVTAAA